MKKKENIQRQEEIGHLPWYRRMKFILGFLSVFIVYTAFLMPPMGDLSALNAVELSITMLLYIAVLIIVQIDREKPLWLKNIMAVGFVVLLGLLFYRHSGARWGELDRLFFNFSIMSRGDFMDIGVATSNWTLMFEGMWTAIKLFLISLVLSTLLALLLAVIRSMVNDVLLNFFIDAYADIFRAVPPIVLLMVVYSSLPYTGIVLNPFQTGVVALTLIEGGYLSEVFRAGIESIHKRQVESARALGLNAWKAMRLVILPQAVRVIIPPYTNRMIGLMKRTALTSVIAIGEVLKIAREIQSFYANATPLIIGAGMYLLLLFPLTKFATYLENKQQRA